MKYLIKIIIFFIITSNINAQSITPNMLGFEAFNIDINKFGKVNYYVSKSDKNLPLLVYLDGSGAFPLFQKMEQGIGSTVVLDFQKLLKKFRIVLISKPGVPFIDKVERDINGFPKYNAPNEYTQKLTLDWRVNTADKIIDKILSENKEKPTKIVLLGFSEGAQVAPHVAKINSKITHLMLFGGNGLNQFFDPIIKARMEAKIGKTTEVKAQKTVDSLFKIYKEIYKNKDEVNKSWWGHTYARWSSFTTVNPIDALVDLDIPIYMANGSLDENSVLSADYVMLEFIKRNKDNLIYTTYPNYNHQMNELQFKDGKFIKAVPKIQLVMQEAFKWLENNK